MPPRGCKGYPVQGGQLPGPLDTSSMPQGGTFGPFDSLLS